MAESVKCRALINLETDERCGDVADCEDECFAYPMCERHASIAYACMDADADMLANAY